MRLASRGPKYVSNAMALLTLVASPLLFATDLESDKIEKSSVATVADAGKVSVADASGWPVVLLTLLGIVCLIFLMAWFVKRFGSISGMGGRDITVLSAMSVGSREKIALIDVKGTQLVVGVTAHSINQLHTFDDPVVDLNAPTKHSFSDSLKQAFDTKNQRSEPNDD